MLFGQVLSGIIGPEGVSFLIDIRGFIEEELNFRILNQFNNKLGLKNVNIPFTSVKQILDKVFGYGTYETRNKFLDKLKENFPDINKNYSVPYELFLNYCVSNFCLANSEKTKSFRTVEANLNYNIFADKIDEYKVRNLKDNVDIKLYDKLNKICKRQLKDVVKLFVDMILEDVRYSDREEFEEFKTVVAELLIKKAESLVDAIVSGHRDMWFSLLTIENPNENDLIHVRKIEAAFTDLVRFQTKNNEI